MHNSGVIKTGQVFMLCVSLCAGFIGFYVPVNAQDFALFEAVETVATDAPRQRVSRVMPAAGAVTPEFTLTGTSRIGDDYKVLLTHKSGENLQVTVQPAGSFVIPSHSNYAIVDVAAGRVSIRYPDSSCQPLPEQGVSCNAAGDIAFLQLVTAKPIAVSKPPAGEAENANGASVAIENPDNPFAIIRARQAQQNADNLSAPEERFTPRRIDPSEVPPGMRVVSTPFGDRLVTQ